MCRSRPGQILRQRAPPTQRNLIACRPGCGSRPRYPHSTEMLLLPTLVLAFSAGAPRMTRTPSPRMVAASPLADAPTDTVTPMLSGLNGKALLVEAADVPSKAQVRAVVPAHCFSRSTPRSLGHLAQSLACTAATAALGLLIPLKLIALPLWIAYACVTGTAAMGLWVLAHECGHGAFSDNRLLQDTVGYILHSALLVPYFSWQRSHAVHHAHTNHIYSARRAPHPHLHAPTRAGPTHPTHARPLRSDRPQRARRTCQRSSAVGRAMRPQMVRRC